VSLPLTATDEIVRSAVPVFVTVIFRTLDANSSVFPKLIDDGLTAMRGFRASQAFFDEREAYTAEEELA
jgi:hypothetical protein